MSKAYKLLENGEDPSAEPDELDTSIPISKGRRQVLESIQLLKAHFTFLQESTDGVWKSLPERLRPVCTLWSCLVMLAAMLIAMVVALVVLGALGGESTSEDVSEPKCRILRDPMVYFPFPLMGRPRIQFKNVFADRWSASESESC